MSVSTGFHTVEEYIAAQPEPLRGTLERLRHVVRTAAPGAAESISYGMPTYRAGDGTRLHFAAWKKHFSLYAATAAVVAAFSAELAPYKIDKGTIQFPFASPFPQDLIARIVKFRFNATEESTES